MTLILEQRHVYGNTFFYPSCDKSRLFASLRGTKTLTRTDIDIIKELGYQIQVTAKLEEF